MSELELRNVAKAYGSTPVIADFSLTVEPGEFVVIVGPSGCGKSTLLRMIAGLESASSGQIFLGGKDVTTLPPVERSVAMVFQNYALYPHMTVAENIGFGLRLAGLDKAARRKKIEAAAKILRIESLLDRKPQALSGGQRQRVAIGRAIVKRPRLFLFDEPLSNLDAELRTQMRVELAKLHRTMNATMVYITHDQTEAMTMADRIVVLRGGSIEQVGKPVDLYRNPDNAFIASFIGSPKINFFDVHGERGNERATSPFPVALHSAARMVGVRPEHIHHAPHGLHFAGTVEIVERLGYASYLYVRMPDGLMVTILERGTDPVSVGDALTFEAPQEHILMFGADGQRVRLACAA
jgi:ABC-type sugar transport system ATPase subunit